MIFVQFLNIGCDTVVNCHKTKAINKVRKKHGTLQNYCRSNGHMTNKTKVST